MTFEEAIKFIRQSRTDNTCVFNPKTGECMRITSSHSSRLDGKTEIFVDLYRGEKCIEMQKWVVALDNPWEFIPTLDYKSESCDWDVPMDVYFSHHSYMEYESLAHKRH